MTKRQRLERAVYAGEPFLADQAQIGAHDLGAGAWSGIQLG
jgi:hypothetical protein